MAEPKPITDDFLKLLNDSFGRNWRDPRTWPWTRMLWAYGFTARRRHLDGCDQPDRLDTRLNVAFIQAVGAESGNFATVQSRSVRATPVVVVCSRRLVCGLRRWREADRRDEPLSRANETPCTL